MKIRSVWLLILVFVTACASPPETVFVPMKPSEWIQASGSTLPEGTITEFVRKGESISNWQHKFTMQFTQDAPSELMEAMEALKQRMAVKCPGAYGDILDQGPESVLYEWKLVGCPGQVEQYEIGRLLRGNEGIHRVAYSEMAANIPAAMREKWIKTLSSAYVSKNGKRVFVAL